VADAVLGIELLRFPSVETRMKPETAEVLTQKLRSAG
jgi:hypothetical protein